MTSSKSEKKETNNENVRIDWKDYIAFIVALFTTALLPFVLLITFLIILYVIFMILV